MTDIFRTPPAAAVEAMRQAAYDRWLAEDTPGEPWCDEYALRLIPAIWPVAMREAVAAGVAVVQDRIATVRRLLAEYPAGDTEYNNMIEECEEIEYRLTALLPPDTNEEKNDD